MTQDKVERPKKRGAVSADRQARPIGRPSALAAGQIEEDLMDAAMAVFIQQGYAGSSMEAIARAAGVTKRTLYRRATGKQELFVAVVERLAGRAGLPQLTHIKGDTLEERLKAASDIVLAWVLEPQALALYRLVIADAAHRPGLALTVDAPFQRATQAIAALLAQGDERAPEVIRMGADMFLRLVAAEPLDRAAQGIEAPGTSPAKQARAHIGVQFFLAGWRSWGKDRVG